MFIPKINITQHELWGCDAINFFVGVSTDWKLCEKIWRFPVQKIFCYFFYYFSLNRGEWNNLLEKSSVLCMSWFQFFGQFQEIFANLVKPRISFFKIINHQDSNGLTFFSIHPRFQNSFKHDFKLFFQKIESAIPCWQFSRFWFHWLFAGYSFNQCNCPWVFHVILRIVKKAGKEPGIGCLSIGCSSWTVWTLEGAAVVSRTLFCM